MKHGKHPVENLLPGDRLNGGQIVVDCISGGPERVLLTLSDPEQYLPVRRGTMVEVNKPG